MYALWHVIVQFLLYLLYSNNSKLDYDYAMILCFISHYTMIEISSLTGYNFTDANECAHFMQLLTGQIE